MFPELILFSQDFRQIDDDFYDELEETLIMGDIGVVATEEILDDLKGIRLKKIRLRILLTASSFLLTALRKR